MKLAVVRNADTRVVAKPMGLDNCCPRAIQQLQL